MSSKKILSIISFLIILFSSIVKAHSIEPDVFIQSTVNRAAKTLSGTLSKKERVKKLKEIARETVDIRGIGLYSLGSFRKNLNDEQRKEYEKIFEEYFLESFSSRLAEYSNPEIEVVSKKKINENYTMVNSTLIATDARAAINIGWRVYTKNPENLLIRDLIIEGLSLVRTQKEEFESIINSNEGKIEVLFQNLSNFNNKQ
jgi:phospholipid transport system substrate-binding protein